MAKKSTSKKISVNAFEKAYKAAAAHEESTTIEWGGLEIVVRHTLPLAEVFRYVEEVSSGCFIGENDRFAPEGRWFLNRAAIIAYYTNIVLPADASKQYEMLCNSRTLFEKILSAINLEQYEEIQRAIDERLRNYNTVATSIALRQLEVVNSAIEDIEGKFNDVFGEIDGRALNAAVAAIGKNGFSEEELVKAVLEERRDETQYKNN